MDVFIVAGLLVYFLGDHDHEGRDAAQSQLRALSVAANNYHEDVGAYPPSLKALIEKPSGAEGWQGPYLTTHVLPKDPWGNDYRYKMPGANSRDFDIWSVGPDGESGTKDDRTSW